MDAANLFGVSESAAAAILRSDCSVALVARGSALMADRTDPIRAQNQSRHSESTIPILFLVAHVRDGPRL